MYNDTDACTATHTIHTSFALRYDAFVTDMPDCFADDANKLCHINIIYLMFARVNICVAFYCVKNGVYNDKYQHNAGKIGRCLPALADC